MLLSGVAVGGMMAVGHGAAQGKPGAVFKRMHTLFGALRNKECARAHV